MAKKARCNNCPYDIITNSKDIWVHKNNRIFHCYSRYEYSKHYNYKNLKDLMAEPIKSTIAKLKVFNSKDLLKLFDK